MRNIVKKKVKKVKQYTKIRRIILKVSVLSVVSEAYTANPSITVCRKTEYTIY